MSYKPTSVDLGVILPKGTAQKRYSMQPVNRDDDDPVHVFSSADDRTNLALKGGVYEVEQLLETTYELQISNAETSRDTLKDRLDQGNEALRLFDEKYSWAMPSTHSKDSLIESNHLQITKDVLRQLLRQVKRFVPPADDGTDVGRSRTPSLYPVNDSASEAGSVASTMQSVTLPNGLTRAPERAQSLCTELLREPLGPVRLESITHTLRSTCRALLGNQVDVAELLIDLHHCVHTDILHYIREKLANHERTWNAAIELCRMLEEERENAMFAEEYALADTKSIELVHASEKAVLEAWFRVNTCMLSSANEGNFRSSYEKLRDELREVLVERREFFTKEILAKGKADVEVCEKYKVSIDEENDKKSKAYREWKEQSEARLLDNGKSQIAIWNQIQTLMEQMEELGKEHNNMVNEHTRITEEECRRRRYYKELTDVLDRHMDHLRSLITVGESSVQLLNGLDDYSETGFLTVESRNFDDGLQEIRSGELNRFQEVYELFVRFAAERQATFINRITIVDKQLNLTELNLRSTVATLDPNRPMYLEQRSQQNTQRADILKQSQVLTALEVSLKGYWEEVQTSILSLNENMAPSSPELMPGASILVSPEEIAEISAITKAPTEVKDMEELRTSVIIQYTEKLVGAVAESATEEETSFHAAEQEFNVSKLSVERTQSAFETKRKGKILKSVDPMKSPMAPGRKLRGVGVGGLVGSTSVGEIPLTPEKSLFKDRPQTAAAPTTKPTESVMVKKLELA